MTAVRSFARSKPIVVVKSGTYDISALVALTHSGFLAGEDKVYDAVFKRAGAVRIHETLDLFYLAETFAEERRPTGKRLAIITNASSPSIMAVDALVALEGDLATFGDDTLKKLRESFPALKQMQNPVHLLTNASPEDYKTAITHCFGDSDIDGVLVIHVPNFGSQPRETAEAIIAAKQVSPDVPLFTVLMGGVQVHSARDFLIERMIPTFLTPEHAVRSFIYMYRYGYNLKLLRETPETILRGYAPDREKAHGIIKNVLDQKRLALNLSEATDILQSYGIPGITTKYVQSEDEAARVAKDIGFPVVLKIDSKKIFDKRERGGLLLSLRDAASVKKAFRSIKDVAVSNGDPEAQFLIQPMIIKHGYRLVIGARKDPTFGSVIIFGTGGELIGAIGDYAVGLPPLNQTLARRMMEETKIYKFLSTQDRYEGALRSLEEMLVRFSYLLVDFSEMKEIAINPFFVTEREVLALDANIVLEEQPVQEVKGAQRDLCPPHLLICPYPFKYVKEIELENGVSALMRPIRSEDEPLIYKLFASLSEESIVFRFNQRLTDMPHEWLARYCQLDYEREFAIVALVRESPERERIIADVRILTLPDLETAELAILVADEWQGQGIGTMLIDYCVTIARDLEIKTLWMEIMRSNSRMLHLAKDSGFE
jgi:acetyltransferase